MPSCPGQRIEFAISSATPNRPLMLDAFASTCATVITVRSPTAVAAIATCTGPDTPNESLTVPSQTPPAPCRRPTSGAPGGASSAFIGVVPTSFSRSRMMSIPSAAAIPVPEVTTMCSEPRVKPIPVRSLLGLAARCAGYRSV